MVSPLELKDWVGNLSRQLEELPQSEEGFKKAIQLCGETLAEIGPYHAHLQEQSDHFKNLLQAARSLYKSLFGEDAEAR